MLGQKILFSFFMVNRKKSLTEETSFVTLVSLLLTFCLCTDIIPLSYTVHDNFMQINKYVNEAMMSLSNF